jgi:hypothetical protein
VSDLHVHIESLELVGFERRDGKRIAAAISRELTRLLTASGADRARLSQLPACKIDAGAVRHETGARPELTGRRVAQALHRTLR